MEVFIKRFTKLDNLRLNHLAQQVVAFTRSFAYACKNREARSRFRDVVDQLHHDNRLAHAGAAEQTDLAAAHEWLDQVDDLDARFKHLQFS